MMRVLMINGSPHKNGNTAIGLQEIDKIFQENDVETETIWVGNKDIRGCTSCRGCAQTGKCVFDDIVNETAPKFEMADGIVIGTPVYFGSANSTLVSFLTRLFFSTSFDKTMKVGAAFAVARRGGISATYDELNKFFAISGMPIVSGQYWSGIHGREIGEASEDAEGLQQMRTLARNMVFLLRSIADGKKKYGLPKKEPFQMTNFVR